ncbi:MAG: HpcH/HpaI aldolase/citrate lyase family protein [Nocardioides sp.]
MNGPVAGPALLFCPADRPARFDKAAAAADMVIIDLEDGVGPADKAAARRHVREATLDPVRTIVRVNPSGSVEHRLDLEALRHTPYRLIMLAKTGRVGDLDGVVDALEDVRVVALCETALGVINAPEIAAEPVVAGLMWGAEDLVASLRGRSSRHRGNGSYRDVARHARSRVLLAAGAFGKAAIDAVHLDIADVEGLRSEAEDAAASGFAATACIHPGQVPTVRAAYAPTAEDVARAEELLRAARGESGVFRFEGRMVDEPMLRQARRIVAAARERG